jgi:hypothetical protein
LLDLADASRLSFRGAAAELREVLRELIDYLAPDTKRSSLHLAFGTKRGRMERIEALPH